VHPHESEDLIGRYMLQSGTSRRQLLEFCGQLAVAAPLGLMLTSEKSHAEVVKAVESTPRPTVVWLHFQDCTGCSETLLRTSKPDLASLILDLIDLEYHETLMAAYGHHAEALLDKVVKEKPGKYVCIVEGSIPTKEQGGYMKLAGKPALKVLEEVGGKAGAVIAMGSCASWGGVPSAGPNPTGAQGVDTLLKGVPIVNIPGCPPNPYTLLGTVLEFAKYGKLPELDDKKRPKFAYDRYIHEHCPRRAHFDAGRFAKQFGDAGHEQGYCLYELGCKGPVTKAGCSTRHFNDTVDAWPIGIGSPCFGCTEQGVGFTQPIFSKATIKLATPPATYPLVKAPSGNVDPRSTGLTGFVAGVLVGAGAVAARNLSSSSKAPEAPKAEGSHDEKKP
jgi:hydrogenase small subunit